MFRFVFTVVLAFAWPLGLQAQLSFSLAKCITLPKSGSRAQGTLGGISGMQYREDGNLLLVSDKDRDGYSYGFTVDTNGNVLHSQRWYNLQNVECVRTNKRGRYYYSFEGNSNTGVGFIDKGQPKIVFSEDIPGDHATFNRGIEGITFTADGCLWVAFEAGGGTDCAAKTLPFYQLQPKNGKFYTANKKVFHYSFDRCGCASRFNGTIGNGVTEILSVPGQANKLLVLERCFSGIAVHVKLFMATIPTTGSQLDKELVFNFNSSITVNGKRFYPDNLEAMDWGPMEGGKRTLYLVSDDNYNVMQRTQIIKLVEN